MKKLLTTTFLAASLLAAQPAAADVAAGLSARDAGEWEQALTEFDKALKEDATSFEANWRMGETLVMLGEAKEALDYLETAIEQNPNHADAHYWWGAANGEMAGQASIFSASGYAKACRTAFEKAVELDPGHLDAREGLLQYYLEAPGFLGGDSDKALGQAQAIFEQDRERGYLNLAAVYNGTKAPDKALSAYNDLLSEFPESSRGYFSRGMMLRQTGKLEAAFKDFDKLASLDPTVEEDAEFAAYRVRLGLYFKGAVASQTKTNLDDGIDSLKAYLAEGDFDVPARKNYGHYYLAVMLLEKGDADKAREMYEIAAKDNKDKDLKKRLKKLRKRLKKA